MQVRELEADNSEFRRRLTASETAARERAQRGQELEHQLSVARLNAEAAESASRGSQALANQAVQRAERSEDELRRIQQQLEALHEKARHEAGKSGHLTAEVERLKKETEQTKQEKNHSAQLSAAREAELLGKACGDWHKREGTRCYCI